MEFTKIRELVADFENSDLRELKLDDGDFHLYLSKNKSSQGPNQLVVPVTQPAEKTSTVPTEPADTAIANDEPATEVKTVDSPLVGTVYLQEKPGAAPFVKVGDHVSVGQTICIVEAMKMLTEIKSDLEGTVRAINVENEELVEVGQPLISVGD